MYRCIYCNGELDTGFNCIKCGKNNQPQTSSSAQTDGIRQADLPVSEKFAEEKSVQPMKDFEKEFLYNGLRIKNRFNVFYTLLAVVRI